MYRRITTTILLVVPAIFYYIVIDALDYFPDLFFWELTHEVHGLFFLGAVIYAAASLDWRGFLLTWLAAFLVHLPRTMLFTLSTRALTMNLGFWALLLFAGAALALERHLRAIRRQAELDRRREQELSVRKILEAQEEERGRIAKEIHDETLQDLVALSYTAASLLEECRDRDVGIRDKAQVINETSVRVARELRRISADLSPTVLEHLGLVAAIGWLAERNREQGDIPTSVDVIGTPSNLTKQVETTVFRVVQEALNNVRKHSSATQARVFIEFKHDSVELQVQDNGLGFDPAVHMHRLATEGHLGLLGVRERIAAVGGTFGIYSAPITGTVLSVRIPCSKMRP